MQTVCHIMDKWVHSVRWRELRGVRENPESHNYIEIYAEGN